MSIVKIYFLLLIICSIGILYSFSVVELSKIFLKLDDPYCLCDESRYEYGNISNCIDEINKLINFFQKHIMIFNMCYYLAIKLLQIPYYSIYYISIFICTFHDKIVYLY